MTNYWRNKDIEINYSYYNNQGSHSEKRLGPISLLLGKREEDFLFNGEYRLSRIIKECVVFRIEFHITCKLFCISSTL